MKTRPNTTLSFRTHFRLLAIFLAAFVFCLNSKAQTDAVVKVNADSVLCDYYFGTGQILGPYQTFDVSEADWNKLFARLDFSKLSFTRLMMACADFCWKSWSNGNPQYEWDNVRMKRFYKMFDYCQSRNITVWFGDWDCGFRHHPADFPFNFNSPEMARVNWDIVDYLINTKGYTCIKWYNYGNEVNANWAINKGDYETWRIGFINMYNELQNRPNLKNKIKLLGTDETFSVKYWYNQPGKVFEDSVLRSMTDIWEYHQYVNWDLNTSNLTENVEKLAKDVIARKNKYDDPKKKVFIGEFGLLIKDGGYGDCQIRVREFRYGVTYGEAIIQALRAGIVGFNNWSADDVMYCKEDPIVHNGGKKEYDQRKIWGMWDMMATELGDPKDEELRPVYYMYSLLGRFIPEGSKTLYADSTGIPTVYVTAAKIANKDKWDLTFAMANNSDTKRTIKLVLPNAKDKVTLTAYEYRDANNDNEVDAWPVTVDEKGNDIWPTAGAKNVLKEIDIANGTAITLNPRTILILTTIEGGKAIRLN